MVEHIDNSNPKSIKVEVEVRTEITIRGTIRTNTGQVVETENNKDKTEVGLDMKKL